MYDTVEPAHTSLEPVIDPGVEGAEPLRAIVIVLEADVPHEFDAVTKIFPAFEPRLTTMLFVPDPELIVAAAGRVQLYVVAPATGLTE